MAGSQEVTSPDQHKPLHMRAWRIAAVVSAIIMLLMIIGNHTGNVENLWLIGCAALLLGTVAVDWLLRKNGLKS